jgi:hypothetical protein
MINNKIIIKMLFRVSYAGICGLGLWQIYVNEKIKFCQYGTLFIQAQMNGYKAFEFAKQNECKTALVISTPCLKNKPNIFYNARYYTWEEAETELDKLYRESNYWKAKSPVHRLGLVD